MTGSNGQMRMRRPHGDAGASLVEFAVIAPLLLLVLLGIVEFARLGLATTEIRTAAREGARYATVVGDSNGDGLPNFVDCNGIIAAAQAKVVTYALASDDIDVEYMTPDATEYDCQGVSPPSGADDLDSGTTITVTARARFRSVVPIVGQFLEGMNIDSVSSRNVNYGSND